MPAASRCKFRSATYHYHTQTFSITVTDTAPVLQNIVNQTVSHTQGPIGVTLTASDADSDPLTYNAQLVGTPAVTLTRSGNQITLTPAGTYIGTFQVQASVSDGILTTAQTFSITVTDNAPVLVPVATGRYPTPRGRWA